MLRAILAGIVTLAAALPAAAETYSDPDGLFRMNMPDGWYKSQPVSPLLGINVQISSPRPTSGGNCNVIVKGIDALKSLTQAQIDAQMAAEINDEFWTSELKAAGFTTSTIEKSGSRQQFGRNVQFVRATSEGTFGPRTIRVTQLQDMHATPGHLYAVTCTALADAVAGEDNDFTTIMTSFEPMADVPVAALDTAQPLSLALYERKQFGGVSHLITQDTRDLRQAGWTRAAASLSVGGAGAWEVCEGVDYSGHCRVIASTTATLPGRSGLTVASARRLDLVKDQVVGRLLKETSGAALAQSVAVVRAH